METFGSNDSVTLKGTSTISKLSYLDDMIEVVLRLVRLESLLGLKVALVVRLLQLLLVDPVH